MLSEQNPWELLNFPNADEFLKYVITLGKPTEITLVGAFGKEGRVRPFGVGARESTIFPVWWWMFAFAVVSYLGVAYYLDYSL